VTGERLFTGESQSRVEAAIFSLLPLAAGGMKHLPHGFANADEFQKFGACLYDGLKRAGFEDVNAIFQGSAVTGVKHKTGEPFDVGRHSDFDIALAGGRLFERARELGIGLRSKGTRTGPLRGRELEKLGIIELRTLLSQMAGRRVNFMIYENTSDALERGPSIVVP
jgi:filamentous hemagglutinin